MNIYRNCIKKNLHKNFINLCSIMHQLIIIMPHYAPFIIIMIHYVTFLICYASLYNIYIVLCINI